MKTDTLLFLWDIEFFIKKNSTIFGIARSARAFLEMGSGAGDDQGDEEIAKWKAYVRQVLYEEYGKNYPSITVEDIELAKRVLERIAPDRRQTSSPSPQDRSYCYETPARTCAICNI